MFQLPCASINSLQISSTFTYLETVTPILTKIINSTVENVKLHNDFIVENNIRNYSSTTKNKNLQLLT